MADLSGELSRRNLESDAGRMRREARRLNRAGYRGAANEVALASARASLSQGPGFSSADEQKKIQEYQNRLEGGLANQRRSQLRRDAGITDAATGDQLSMRQRLFRDMQSAGSSGLTSEMRDRAEKLGVTQAGWEQAVGKIGQAPAIKQATTISQPTPSPINPAYAPPGLQWDNDSNSVPDSIQRPAESRINGMPAGQAIRESRQRIIDRDGGIDPITGKPADTSLVKQTESLRDVNRILESRNRPPVPAPPAPATPAPSMTIGGAPVDAGKFRQVSPEESAARKAEDERVLQLARGLQSGGAAKPTQPATDQDALDARLEATTKNLEDLSGGSLDARLDRVTDDLNRLPAPQGDVSQSPQGQPARNLRATFTPSEKDITSQRSKQVSELRKKAREEYNAEWNKAPNLSDSLGNDSTINKAYKSLRTFARGYSY